jgi:hypothetical protein
MSLDFDAETFRKNREIAKSNVVEKALNVTLEMINSYDLRSLEWENVVCYQRFRDRMCKEGCRPGSNEDALISRAMSERLKLLREQEVVRLIKDIASLMTDVSRPTELHTHSERAVDVIIRLLQQKNFRADVIKNKDAQEYIIHFF